MNDQPAAITYIHEPISWVLFYQNTKPNNIQSKTSGPKTYQPKTYQLPKQTLANQIDYPNHYRKTSTMQNTSTHPTLHDMQEDRHTNSHPQINRQTTNQLIPFISWGPNICNFRNLADLVTAIIILLCHSIEIQFFAWGISRWCVCVLSPKPI